MTQEKNLSIQLFILVGMIFCMIVLGGLTRLTGSGLSIVEWKPLTGIFPPLNHQDWQRIFDLYQLTPEYHKVNYGMNLTEFKQIFWLEYIHRLWGRLIGLAFLCPLVYAFKHRVLRAYVSKLIGIWLLGAAQGLVGWYMVKSGLIHDPHVSPYRLALHLSLGIVSLSALLWLALNLMTNQIIPINSQSCRGLIIIMSLLSLTILYGALVAGMKAGLIYNSFPLMGDRWVPEDAFFMQPIYLNFVQNPATVQWVHRLLAMSTFVGIWSYIRWEFQQQTNRSTPLVWVQVLGAVSIIQIFLGIITIIYQVPVLSALLHQAMAVILWAVLLILLHQRLNARKWFSLQKFKKCPAAG
jgi:cytochrome c oxidase assembly protein subunit 15